MGVPASTCKDVPALYIPIHISSRPLAQPCQITGHCYKEDMGAAHCPTRYALLAALAA